VIAINGKKNKTIKKIIEISISSDLTLKKLTTPPNKKKQYKKKKAIIWIATSLSFPFALTHPTTNPKSSLKDHKILPSNL
jgi:hypothetical protein